MKRIFLCIVTPSPQPIIGSNTPNESIYPWLAGWSKPQNMNFFDGDRVLEQGITQQISKQYCQTNLHISQPTQIHTYTNFFQLS